MSVKQLEAIKKAETKTESMLQKARQQGEKIVEEATQIMHKEITEAQKNAKMIVKDMMVSAKKDSQQQLQVILDKTDTIKKEIFLHLHIHGRIIRMIIIISGLRMLVPNLLWDNRHWKCYHLNTM